jgi:hypothetical protein
MAAANSIGSAVTGMVRELSMDNQRVNDQIALLIENWCQRRELTALATVLPAWVGNNRLTDGWSELGLALRSASTLSIPAEEREAAKRLWIEIDTAINRR